MSVVRTKRHWFVEVDGTTYRAQLPNYLHEAGVDNDIVFFLAELRLFLLPGKLYRNDAIFLYRCDPMMFILDDLNTQNVKLVPEPLWFVPDDLERVDYSWREDVFHYLAPLGAWTLFEKKLELIGPVSYFSASLPRTDFVIFGDVHDNLLVPGKYSHHDVKDMFQDFFGASRLFFADRPDFAHFKFVVNAMIPQLYIDRFFLKVFIWEYLVWMLHLLQDSCVDVFVEDALHMPFEPRATMTYLDVVRYLFSICPMMETLDEDAPFAPFVKHCRELFPNLRYHRIDLRFNIHEDAMGTFSNDTPQEVVTTLTALLMLHPQLSSEDFKGVFNQKVEELHGMDNAQDKENLLAEFKRMQHSFRRSTLADDVPTFAVVLTDAIKQHWKSGEARSKWFLFRTTLTDIYGLSRLLRQEEDLVKKQHPLQNLQTFTKPCQESNVPQKALVYIGDYHAKVWTDVLRTLYSANMRIHGQQTTTMNRVLYFEKETVKPLMSPKWNDAHQVFNDWMQNATDRKSWEARQWQFVGMLNSEMVAKYYVPYLTQTELFPPDFRARIVEFGPPLIRSALKKAQELIELRHLRNRECDQEHDAFYTDFNDMDEAEIRSVYAKDKQCYSAMKMYAYWEQSYQDRRAFRDPITRKAIQRDEGLLILERSLHRFAPNRIANRPLPTLHFGRFSVSEITLVKVQIESGPLKYFLCFVNRKTSQIKEALEEFVRYARYEWNHATRTITHESVHLNNFQNADRWANNQAATLAQWKEEMTPFISFDWK